MLQALIVIYSRVQNKRITTFINDWSLFPMAISLLKFIQGVRFILLVNLTRVKIIPQGMSIPDSRVERIGFVKVLSSMTC